MVFKSLVVISSEKKGENPPLVSWWSVIPGVPPEVMYSGVPENAEL